MAMARPARLCCPACSGSEFIEAFREFKALWDPDNRMNPGKLSDAVRVYDPIENLRHSTHEGAPGPLQLGTREASLAFAKGSASTGTRETNFAFSKDTGSLTRATERCVGVGTCRNTVSGVMCPSYRATGEEQHSTRGRAHLLWEMLAGSLRNEGFQSESVHEALDLCLSCKACKSECPVQVDMAAYKSEFLAQRYKGRPHPLHHYIFGFADRLARYGSLAPALTNAILTGPLTSPLIKHIAGVAQERKLPRLASKTFQSTRRSPNKLGAPDPAFETWNSTYARVSGAPGPPRLGTRETTNLDPRTTVLMWPDTWNNYYHPATLSAADTVLTAAGFNAQTPTGHICCGRPLYDFGLLDSARSYLAGVLTRLSPQIDAGLPFIFLEPSCASVFKDELLELFPNDARAKRLSDNVWLLADFLAAHAPDFATGKLAGTQILVHGHCHHKAVFGGPASEIALLAQNRRKRRTHRGRLLRHGRTLRL